MQNVAFLPLKWWIILVNRIIVLHKFTFLEEKCMFMFVYLSLFMNLKMWHWACAIIQVHVIHWIHTVSKYFFLDSLKIILKLSGFYFFLFFYRTTVLDKTYKNNIFAPKLFAKKQSHIQWWGRSFNDSHVFSFRPIRIIPARSD